MDCGSIAVSNDLGDDHGSQRQMTASNDVGDDVGDDVGNGDNGDKDAGNNAGKGDGGDAVGRGRGAPGGERGGGGNGGGSGGGSNGSGGGCIMQGSFAFYCKDIFVWYFYVWGGIGKVTPPLTLSSRLRYVDILLGGDGNCPQKLWYVNTKNYLAKKHGNQSW